jgi:hypothetical protein
VKFLCLSLLAALLAAPIASRAEENRYDLVSRLLLPFVNVFAKTTSNPNRAFQLTARLEQMTDVPAELVGSQAELAVEYPDKLRLRAPLLGEEVTICRRGDDLWAYPGAKIEALLRIAGAAKRLPKPDKKFRLEPFSLPIPEKQLVFIPALLQIKDVGSEPLGGESCRVLDLFLMPELAKSLKAPGWAMRVWARPNATPARISIAKPGWNLVVRVERIEFVPTLPASTWEPTTEQASDVLQLDPARYQQLLETLVK